VFDYNFMLIYPPCEGTALGEMRHNVTIPAERPTDAFRRLWQTLDDMRWGGTGANCAVPTVLQLHGPRQRQYAMLGEF
jgi:hypothetical protein